MESGIVRDILAGIRVSRVTALQLEVVATRFSSPMTCLPMLIAVPHLDDAWSLMELF